MDVCKHVIHSGGLNIAKINLIPYNKGVGNLLFAKSISRTP